MEEAGEEPPYIIHHNEYFIVYERRRRKFLSGTLPHWTASEASRPATGKPT